METEKNKKAVARIVADCPKCQTQCEITDLKDNGFGEEGNHCCMHCGESFDFDA